MRLGPIEQIVRQSMIAEKPLLIEGRADQIHRQRLSFFIGGKLAIRRWYAGPMLGCRRKLRPRKCGYPSNPQNARVKRLTGARSVVIGRIMPFLFLFRRHSEAPSSGRSNEKQRGSAERNHVGGFRSGVAGVYNLARYEAEMRDALARWADCVEALVGPLPLPASPPPRPKALRLVRVEG
jgi:hypothetical protein